MRRALIGFPGLLWPRLYGSPWAVMGWALIGIPWAVMGSALMGRALLGPLGRFSTFLLGRSSKAIDVLSSYMHIYTYMYVDETLIWTRESKGKRRMGTKHEIMSGARGLNGIFEMDERLRIHNETQTVFV